MGILNNKTRIFDSILTNEGRNQLANGQLRAEFYSFTDAGIFYKEDTIVSGGLQPTDRFQLEATNLHQDLITLEADDSGHLTGFPISGSKKFILRGGQILSSSKLENTKTIAVTGSQFASLANTLLSSSINNFKKLYILQSPDPLGNKPKKFLLSSDSAKFDITDTRPFDKNSIKEISIDDVESFFQDKRLSHIPNYMFLPPVNKSKIGTDARNPLGEYVNINQEPILEFEDIEKEVNELTDKGFSKTIRFSETSKQNNVLAQMFEISKNKMTKLDVIDFGIFPGEDGKSKHVFFAGKVFLDSNNTHTFVHLFTLIFK